MRKHCQLKEFINRKHKAIEKFGKLSGDRNTQGECYVQLRAIKYRFDCIRTRVVNFNVPHVLFCC